jgi:hypothetical protein
MNYSTHAVLPSITRSVWWSARILSALILLFWGFLILGHLVGDEGRSSRPLTTNDYISLTTMIIALVGLAVAWKKELIGAVVTLIAMLIGAVINWRVLIFPGILVPITACLFLLSWWMNRSRNE